MPARGEPLPLEESDDERALPGIDNPGPTRIVAA